MVDWGHDTISIRRQCGLLGINRASLYYAPRGESEENLRLMRWIDEQYTRAPFFGSRRIAAWLRKEKKADVNRKRVARLMQVMGLEAVYPKPKLSQPGEGHKLYPYLLRDVPVNRVNQVWSTDITYIRMAQGFCYVVAVMDWHILRPSLQSVIHPFWPESGRSQGFGDRVPESSSDPFLINCRRRPVAQTLVGPPVVVELEPLIDPAASFVHALVILQVYLLVFQGSPQPLDEDVVKTASASIHADSDSAPCQLVSEPLTGELRTLIAVEDLRPRPP